MKSFGWRTVSWVCLVLFSSTHMAAAGEPLYTDDPGTPGAGRVEMRLSSQLTTLEEGHVLLIPTIDVAYGLGDRMEVGINIPFLVDDNDEDGTRAGWSHTTLGAKLRFVDETRFVPAIATGPWFTFKTDEASRDSPKRKAGSATFVPVEIGKTFGDLSVYTELGRVFEENASDSWVYGLAAEHPIGDRWTILAELAGDAPRDFSDDELVANVGVVRKLSPSWALSGSVGGALRRADDDGARLLFYLDVLRTF